MSDRLAELKRKLDSDPDGKYLILYFNELRRQGLLDLNLLNLKNFHTKRFKLGSHNWKLYYENLEMPVCLETKDIFKNIIEKLDPKEYREIRTIACWNLLDSCYERSEDIGLFLANYLDDPYIGDVARHYIRFEECSPQLRQKIVDFFRSNSQLDINVLHSISKFKIKELIPDLIKTYKNVKYFMYRTEVAEVIINLGAASFTDDILEDFRSKPMSITSSLITIVAKSSPSKGWEHFRKILENPYLNNKEGVRAAALLAIGAERSERSLSFLRSFENDESLALSGVAYYALSQNPYLKEKDRLKYGDGSFAKRVLENEFRVQVYY